MRIRYLAIVVLAWSVGCSTVPPPRAPGMEAIGVDITTAELRQKIYRYESVFAATIRHRLLGSARHSGKQMYDELHAYDEANMASGKVSCRSCHQQRTAVSQLRADCAEKNEAESVPLPERRLVFVTYRSLTSS